MKLHLKKIEENIGFHFHEELDPLEHDLDIGVMRFPVAVSVEGDAWKQGNDLTVQAHVTAECAMTCSLCLEEFNNVFEKDVTLHYDIKGLDTVVLDSDIRDEIILEHPIRVLCRPDCRGLCARCGANLNQGSCACNAKSTT